ncbi:MAG: hypothetical protein FJ241_11810 [Nitrospira sp.]|nr:hypothetical protein [Nitrospira sp.]
MAKAGKQVSLVQLYEKIAQEVGIEPKLFGKFMVSRFPNEADYYYIKEWAQRFKTGNPVEYMDNASKAIYISLITQI